MNYRYLIANILGAVVLPALAVGCTSAVGAGDAANGGDATDVTTRDVGTAQDAGQDSGLAPEAGDSGPDDAAVDAGEAPDVSVNDAGCSASLRDIQASIFTQRCASTRCHNAGFFAGDLDLTAADLHGQLVGVHSLNSPADVRVVPGDLDQSFLWRKLNNLLPSDLSEGSPMPSGEAIRWTPIPDNEMNQIRCWILSGAPDN